jgi:hypothetical protein
VVCWRKNKVAHDNGWAGQSLGVKTSSRDQGPNFDLIGTSRAVVVRKTREAKHTTCWSGSSPAWCTPIQITVTLLNMSDYLLLLSSRSIFCYIDGMDWKILIIVILS